jgi:hypothetical protein
MSSQEDVTQAVAAVPSQPSPTRSDADGPVASGAGLVAEQGPLRVPPLQAMGARPDHGEIEEEQPMGAEIDDALWEDFHRAVNMTSRELREWLATDQAGEAADGLPDQAGTERSRGVLEILGKRRTDLTHDDVAVMRSVVAEVTAERGPDFEPSAGDAAWRHRLMSLGHDPLKPEGTNAQSS